MANDRPSEIAPFPERFNMAEYFLYHNLAAGRGDKVCLRYRDQSFTYADVCEFSDRVGNVLRELGVEPEDRVLIALPDCPEFAFTWFGAAKIGAVITMVNTILPASDYAYYLQYTRCRVAIVHHSIADRFEDEGARAQECHHLLVAARLRGIGIGEFDSREVAALKSTDVPTVQEALQDFRGYVSAHRGTAPGRSPAARRIRAVRPSFFRRPRLNTCFTSSVVAPARSASVSARS